MFRKPLYVGFLYFGDGLFVMFVTVPEIITLFLFTISNSLLFFSSSLLIFDFFSLLLHLILVPFSYFFILYFFCFLIILLFFPNLSTILSFYSIEFKVSMLSLLYNILVFVCEFDGYYSLSFINECLRSKRSMKNYCMSKKPQPFWS